MIEFSQLTLHDIPVKSLEFDFYNFLLKLVISNYDVEKKENFDVEITFSEVSDINFKDKFNMDECEVTYSKLTQIGDRQHVYLLFLISTEWREMELSFSFSKAEIDHPSGYKVQVS